MQCPKCASRARRDEKARCPECGYAFGLDPAAPHGLSDYDLLRLVYQTSHGGRFHYTLNQLYVNYCAERLPSNALWPLAGMLGGAVGYAIAGTRAGMIGAVSAAAVAYHGTNSWRPPPISVLEEIPEQMAAAGHRLPRFIARPLFEFRDEARYVDHLPRALEVDHVIVVDRDELVDWLVLNDLPRRLNAIIVSQTGYPNYVAPVVYEMLERRKTIGVYLLHDSTDSSTAMRRRLAESALLPTEGHRVYNLGLDPAQVTFMKRLRPIQPAQKGFGIPVDSIPYPILASALHTSIARAVPLLTGFAATGWVGKED